MSKHGVRTSNPSNDEPFLSFVVYVVIELVASQTVAVVPKQANGVLFS